jgi:hypothetical protein
VGEVQLLLQGDKMTVDIGRRKFVFLGVASFALPLAALAQEPVSPQTQSQPPRSNVDQGAARRADGPANVNTKSWMELAISLTGNFITLAGAAFAAVWAARAAVRNTQATITAAEKSIKEQLANDAEKIKTQFSHQWKFELRKYNLRRQSLAVMLSVETFLLRERIAILKTQIPDEKDTGEKIKRMQIQLSDVFNATWDDLALLGSPNVLASISLLKHQMRRIERRLVYLMEKPKVNDPIRTKYIHELSECFNQCENEASSLLKDLEVHEVAKGIIAQLEEVKKHKEQAQRMKDQVSEVRSRPPSAT